MMVKCKTLTSKEELGVIVKEVFYEVKNTEKDLLELKILDHCAGFRVIIVIEANSYVNIKSSRLLPKFKTQKINSWCAA